jgi:uncharacterized membrane protein
MDSTPRILMLVIALILFILATVGYAPPRGNVIAAGLAFLTAGLLLPG